MPIVVTDNGIEDARQAELGGFLVSLTEFSVSEATGFDVVSDRTQLVGTEAFRGKITTIEAVGRDSVRLTCSIPQGRPLSGQWNLSEIGIWNSNGRLFAHGSFSTFPKTTEFGLKFYVFVTLARLGDVINITNSDLMSLPSAARVASLQPPETSSQNVVAVLDSNPHEHEIVVGFPPDTSSPSVAIKYGAGGSRWGFLGSSRVFEGKPENVVSQRVINIDPGKFGFWLTDGEVVIVQVISGGAAGQSRKMQYVHSSKLFNSVDDPFVGLNGTSVIAMWRSHESALPARHAGIPDYMVLGVGINNYSNIFAAITATRLEPKLFSFEGTGSEAYSMNTAQFPLDKVLDTKHLIVQIDGKVLRPDQYVVLGNQLRIVGGLANGKKCTLYGFARSASDPGGVTLFQDAVIQSHGGPDYGLSTAPSSADNVFVFDSSGQQYGKQDFIVVGAKLVFANNSVPPVGRTLSFIVGGVSTSNAVRGTLVRQTQVAQIATREISFTSNIADKNNTLLFINGTYVAKQRYSVTGDKIKTVDNIPQNAVVDLIVFSGEETTSISTRGGYDTGPQWIDPAGEQGMPNKLIPGRVRYLGLGWPSYPVDTVPDANHLIAFVGNRYMPPTTYSFDGHNIYFNEIVTGNTPVEIFCFRSVEHSGTSARPLLSNVVTNGSRTVTVHANANTQSLIVFVGREYRPSTTYTYNSGNGQITFDSDVAAGLTVVAWSYTDQNVAGMQVKMYSTRHGITSDTKYLMQGTLDQTQDMILTSEGRLLGYDAFTLLNESSASYAKFSVIQPGWIGTTMSAVEFSSRIPQRRLALKSELNGFLRADLNLADVPDKAEARANLGIIDAPTGGGGDVDISGLLTKVANLSDVPDKAAARQNLGITDIIAQLMQNVLLKANNLSDVPDKAAARANLGITNVGGGGVTTSFPSNPSIGVTYYGAVDFGGPGGFKIRFGHWWNPNEGVGEGLSASITFRNGSGNAAPFENACFGVFTTDLNPSSNPWNRRDIVSQAANVNKNSFNLYLNDPGDGSHYWRGCFWFAIGT